jgi:hypothetical protein
MNNKADLNVALCISAAAEKSILLVYGVKIRCSRNKIYDNENSTKNG